MKKISVSLLAVLAIVFAVASAFTSTKGSTTYHLYSVDRDEVNTGSAGTMSSYSSSLKTDLVALRSNDIAQTESIQTWIATNSFPNNSLSAYCDQIDTDQVCVVKFTKVDNVNTSVLEFIAGDQLQ